MKLYKQGKDKINKELSIERIVKDLKDLKFIIKHHHTIPEGTMFDFQHSYKFVINIDSSNSDDTR